MKKPLFALACLFLFHLPSIHAQTQLVRGNFFPCVGCHEYSLNVQAGTIVEEFFLEIINEPFPGAASWTQNTNAFNEFTICYEAPGTYTFFLYAYINGNTVFDSLEILVSEIGYAEILPPVCDGFNQNSGKPTACKGSTLAYEAHTTGPIQGVWWVSGGDIVSQNDFSVTVQWSEDEDNGFIEFIGWDNGSPNGCEVEAHLQVKLIDPPKTEFSIENQKADYCVGEEIFLLNETQDGVKFYWDFGNGETSTDIQPIIAYTQPGTYTISLQAENYCDCESVFQMEVTLKDEYMPTIDCRGTICENTLVTYASPDDCGTFFWTVSSHGTVVEGGGPDDNFVTIDWHSGPEGHITLDVAACNFDVCPIPADFMIPIVGDGAHIKGDRTPCAQSLEVYATTAYQSTNFTWTVTGGQIVAGQGTSSIMVQWGNTDGSLSVDYQNCYLDCGASSSVSIDIRDRFGIDGTTEYCLGESLDFSAKTRISNQAAPVDWTLTDGTFSLLTAGGVSDFTGGPLNTPGTFTVYAQSDAHCNDVDSARVLVKPQSPPADSIIGEFAICPGNTYQYEAASSLIQPIFTWMIDDGGTVTEKTGKIIVHQWTSGGPYSIRLAQTEGQGRFCMSPFITESITKVDELAVTGLSEICVDETATYAAHFYEGLDYEWSILPTESGTLIEGQGSSEVQIFWNTAGNHQVVLNACGKQEVFDVAVRPAPVFTPDFEEFICANLTTQVQTDQSFTAYAWKNESGVPVSDEAAPFLTPGSYIAEVVNEYTCSSSLPFTIKALPLPEITISTPDSTGICPADGPRYPTLYAVDAEDGYTYEWEMDNTPTGITANTFVTSQLGAYQVRVTDANGCIGQSNIVRVFEYCGKCIGGVGNGTTCNYPQDCESNSGAVDFEFTAGANCRKFSFQNTSVNYDGHSLKWDFDDARSGADNYSTEENPEHEFRTAGYHVVSLLALVEDANNPGDSCQLWTAKVVTVPLIAAFGEITACPGDSVRFFDRSTFIPESPITTYEWDFGDPSSGADNSSAEADPAHIYAASGQYTVRLVVGNGSCTDTIERVITVYETPQPNIQIDESACEDIAARFSLQPETKLALANWNFGDPASGDKNTSEKLTAYHAFADPGTYDVVAYVRSIYGCRNTVDAVHEVHKNELSGTITSSEGSAICEGASTTLAFSSAAAAYVWSTEENTPTVSVDQAEVYSVEVTDDYGCTFRPDAFVLDVHAAPRVAVYAEVYTEDMRREISERSFSMCAGESLRLVAGENPQFTYAWSTGQTTATALFDENTGLLTAGTHTIQLTTTDNATGCTYASEAYQIEVFATDQNLTIEASTNGVLCKGVMHTLSVKSPVAGTNYFWSNGQTGTSITTDQAGIYTVRGVNANGCESLSNELVVENGPDLSLIPTGCHTRCAPDTICIPPMEAIAEYQWTFNGNPVAVSANGQRPDLIANESGSYQLKLTDNRGCMNTSEPLELTLEEALGRVYGRVWVDVNENGVVDAGDTLKSDVRIVLDSGEETTSGDDGGFDFFFVPGGTYTVAADTAGLGGYTDVSPMPEFTVATCNDTLFVDVLLVKNCEPSAVVLGSVYVDVNENGIIDPADTLKAGATVVLSDGQSAQSDGDGHFRFDFVGGGNYTFVVDTTLLGGYIDISPSAEFAVDACRDTVRVSALLSKTCEPNRRTKVFHLCPGSSVAINGVEYTEPIAFELVEENAAGCLDTTDYRITVSLAMEIAVEVEAPCRGSDNGEIRLTGDFAGRDLQFSVNGIAQTSPVFTDLTTGTYHADVFDEKGCRLASASVAVEARPDLDYDIVQGDFSCEDGTYEISVVVDAESGPTEVIWSNATTGHSALYTQAGWQSVTVRNTCQAITEEFLLSRPYEATDFDVPNVFSPNGDGQNDQFRLALDQLEDVHILNFIVSDRMGRLVYRYQGGLPEWSGLVRNGDAMDSGVYFFYIEVEHRVCGEVRKEIFSGDVTLIK